MATDTRSARLKRVFFAVIDGQRQIETSNDAKLLLSAVCNQADKAQCIALLLSRKYALEAVTKSLRIDLSDSFLNGLGAQCMLYFAHEDLRQLNRGQLLCEFLCTVLKPPLLWEAFKKAAAGYRLSNDGLRAFASLLLELLIVLPSTSEMRTSLAIEGTARSILENNRLQDSAATSLRQLGYKIHETIRSLATSEHQIDHLASNPGGRHNNDFKDFRKIAIFPTTDELLAKDPPFILPAESVLNTDPQDRVVAHLDNQFRLLREDMLAELRDDLKHEATPTRKKTRSTRFRGMQLSGIETGTSPRLKLAAIALRCWDGVFRTLPEEESLRKKYLIENKNFIKHGAFGCLMVGNEVVAFATIDRDEGLLARRPPVILLRIFGSVAISTALLILKTKRPHEIDFVLIDTPFFAYEPILSRLQSMPSLPMAGAILNRDQNEAEGCSPFGLDALAAKIERCEQSDLRTVLNLPRDIRLDHSQTLSLVAGLSQPVGLIQGPPGTGKSFIGAILSRALLKHTSETILVLCYTNHALDQFLEDILDMGIARDDMLRLGSKSTARTKSLSLFEQPGRRTLLPQHIWRLSKSLLNDAEDSSGDLQKRGQSFSRWKCSDKEILENLEFADEDARFFDAFSLPETSDGMVMVGADGKSVDHLYLFNRWKQGKDAGVFQATVDIRDQDVWNMPRPERAQRHARWVKDTMLARVDVLCDTIREYDLNHDRWAQLRDDKTAEIMKSKRLIGCTTTAAAKYARQIQSARPGIVLVEEAGEVLESHILAAMGRETKQLILIGDHLQLRPKINNFALTVERGDGYDLNCSLFERLVLGGHSHTVLTKQHRMRPEISALVRRLMYPNLEDNETTLSRPDIRGLQSNVIFIDHSELEVSDGQLKDRQDGGTKVSRQNPHEVKMVLKIVRYLAQQGYGTDKQVVLTPYLGQLRLLVENLKADHDPVLSDLDSHDLVKAGLLAPASANFTKRQLRVSTVDNFQGEESDIVIVSLTRSNEKGDIGFLSAPQRLNVLLSPGRNGLILIGNANTFRSSKKGRAVWEPFFAQLIRARQFFDGLPVQCEQHLDRCVTLKCPKDFDMHCPNGGCERPCRVLLKCGKHGCPEKCHQLSDHSKMKCKHIEQSQCPHGHQIMLECWQSSKSCSTCERLMKEQEACQQRNLKLATKRELKEKAYLEKLQALDNEIEDQRGVVQDRKEDTDRERALEQKRKDLAQAKLLAQNRKHVQTSSAEETAIPKSSKSTKVEEKEPTEISEAADRWENQKRRENASNEHIDALMKMIGLESVKQQVLDVKDKIDTSLRQGASLQKERFSAVLLGNPGTGKTTVARLYAKCLASMGAVAGITVEETTASQLIHGGVAAFKKLVEKVLNGGGGALFIDEAYQLAVGTSAAGSQVLDALLDEAENQTGKVVFLLAGYKQEMEKVFSHNPGLPSRFPQQFSFEDYNDEELLQILRRQIHERFDGRMQIEDGDDGLFCRIVARRIGQGRGSTGFGNARAVENAFSKVRSRQAARVSHSRRKGQQSDDFLITKEDLIGPEPSSALEANKAWSDLKSLVGLKAVKDSLDALMQSVRYNYERELREEARLDFNLNRVFLGSPGTGKTTVAKLYGRILADLGLLSNGEVVEKNPSDFVGDALGISEKNTRGILASADGKILVIDEAYGLYGGSASSGQSGDPYRTAVIDTLVAEVQSVPGEDQCILLLGYRAQMETMMQNVNPGLTRRFPLSEAFVFEDFTDDELEQVVESKLKQQAYTVTGQAMSTIMQVLQRARNKPHFGNAGEVDILLNAAKERHQKRQVSAGLTYNTTLEAIDIDPEFDRTQKTGCSIRTLFEDTVGNEELILRLEGIQKAALSLRARGLDPRKTVPFNFLFTGPPGTGKTTTARKMGKVYYDMGILGSDTVIEISATELIGQYVGQTGPKTQQQLEKALGKVLFVDEAYRLSEGHFAKEATDEIVDRLTKPEFAQRLIVILAGYDRDMERLMEVNSGLKSRFPEVINFSSLQPKDCLSLLLTKLASESFLDISVLQRPESPFTREAVARFETFTQLGGWANARDVETIAKAIARDQLYNSDPESNALLAVTDQGVLNFLDEMLRERQRHMELTPAAGTSGMPTVIPRQQFLDPRRLDPPGPPRINNTTTDITKHAREDVQMAKSASPEQSSEHRDSEVSDEVWARLELDKLRAVEEEQQYQDTCTQETVLEQERALQKTQAMETRRKPVEEPPEDDAARGVLEQERIARELARRQTDEMLENIRRKRAELERQQEKERKAQQKLRAMGVCVAGFRWIKQDSGYRCAGGSHYVSNAALDSMN